MINLLCAFHWDDHPIHLNHEFSLDLTWWQVFPVMEWLHLSSIPAMGPTAWIWGFLQCLCGAGLWRYNSVSQVLGLVAPYTGLPVNQVQRTFPDHCGSLQRVNFLSDNSSVVEILRSGTSRAPTIMALVPYLRLLAAHYSFSFTASPVSGKCNLTTDSLLHFQFQCSHRLAPHADPNQTQIPRQLLLDLDLLWQINGISTWLKIRWFKITTGDKQGCVMSGILFLLTIDWMMRRTTERQKTASGRTSQLILKILILQMT